MKRVLLFVAVMCAATGWAQGPAQRGPMTGGTSDAAATAADRAQLARFGKERAAAKAAFTKRPKDATVRKRYVAATVRLGTATMTSLALSPRAKYPAALRLYRDALKVDPANREARSNAKMIENIYRSMGRPVPK